MKNKIFLALLCCILNAGSLFAQKDYELPKNIKMETKADYTAYKQDVVHIANWLETMSLNTDLEKRKEMNAFIIQWASGTSDITVEINEEISRLYGTNIDLLPVYIAAYCRYCILHGKADKFSGVKDAVMAMVNVYKKEATIEKVAKMDVFIGMNEADKDRYIRKNILPE